jgi:hypothetical protein
MRWVIRFFRWVGGMPEPAVGREAALRIAREEAVRRGDIPPRTAAVHEGVRTWRVWLDSGLRPSRVVEIDNQTGQVRRYLSPPR